MLIKMPLYDTIGQGYNTTRRADPYLCERFYELLTPTAGGRYLDAGCGTGNYIKALSGMGLEYYGIDPSETMLKEAREKNPGTKFALCRAEDNPFEDNFFDGATAILTLHHWENIVKGLTEVCRVLKPGAKLVMFSFTPEQVRGYWLAHYFPTMIERAANTVPSLNEMGRILQDVGFSSVSFESYFVLPDLQDHFMYSCKHSPERCLLPEMRKNTSGFTALANQEEVNEGLVMLEDDIRMGRIDAVVQQYENDLGDYLFIVAGK